MSFNKNDRTFPPRNMGDNRRMSCVAAISSQSVAQRVGGALRRSVHHFAAPSKMVSRITGRNPRTIRNLMEGTNAPSAATLIELMRDFDEVFNEVLFLSNRMPEEPSGSHHQRIQKAINILSGVENDDTNRGTQE